MTYLGRYLYWTRVYVECDVQNSGVFIIGYYICEITLEKISKNKK